MNGDYDIKILKIKPWMIKFSVNGQKYFIKDTGETFEPVTSLFKFDCDETGHYKTEHVKSIYGSFDPFYLTRCGHGCSYKHIDTTAFIGKLLSYGLNPGIDQDIADRCKKEAEIERIQWKIDRANDELERLKKQLVEVSK